VKITFPLFPAAGPTDVATAHAAIATTVENERVLTSWCAPSTGDRKAAAFSQRRPTVMEPSVPSRLSASIKSDRVIRSLYERQTPDLAVAHKIFGTPRILGSNLIGVRTRARLWARVALIPSILRSCASIPTRTRSCTLMHQRCLTLTPEPVGSLEASLVKHHL
jgi:hypothetical protein